MNKLLLVFKQSFSVPGIRKRIFVTAALVIVFRAIAHIPASGINQEAIRSFFAASPLLSLLDLFSGGTLANFSIMALGLGPYINASIILQLMTLVVPSLEELSKEGESGQEKINQYTRFLTVPLAIFQSAVMYTLLVRSGIITSLPLPSLVGLVATMTAGTMIAVWLGDLITEFGLGQGISILIFVGIVARLPINVWQNLSTSSSSAILPNLGLLLVGFAILVVIIVVNEATRRIPIHYARKSRSLTPAAGFQESYLPLRLNQAGVIPIIFAVSLVLLPSVLTQFLSGVDDPVVSRIAGTVSQVLSPGSGLYSLIYFVLVFGFTFFYTFVVFNPEKIAENLRVRGGFIPGIRPGSSTVGYLKTVLNRITVVGAIFLGVVAVLPNLIQPYVGQNAVVVGGTGILIVVSVILEVTRDLEGKLVMQRYDNLRK